MVLEACDEAIPSQRWKLPKHPNNERTSRNNESLNLNTRSPVRLPKRWSNCDSPQKDAEKIGLPLLFDVEE